MLSPTKMVNSPTALSTTSDVFPRPMTRDPTPERGNAKLTNSRRQHAPNSKPTSSTPPVRLFKRDEYDSVKVNVRRPSRGIQHWFEGYEEDDDDEEDSEELEVEELVPIQALRAPNSTLPHAPPARRSSLKAQPPHAPQYDRVARKAQQFYANQAVAESQSSLATIKTKESSISRVDLHKASFVSFSSSEDEDEDESEVDARTRSKAPVRDSIDMSELQGDIIIGQAQAMEVRPQHTRRPSAGKISLMSTSTNTATIEMIYTPEPYTAPRFPRPSSYSRRPSHRRQPSIIPEDEGTRPKTANDPPLSPSAQSFRTTKSEPRYRQDSQLMAVTAEEMALLEALRKKRADMVQQSWVQGYVTAVKQEGRQTTPPEADDNSYRTSGFLANQSPSTSPVRLVETKKAVQKSIAPAPPPLLVPQGRTGMSQDLTVGTTMLRDSSSCGPQTSPQVSPGSSLARRISAAPEFYPLNPFAKSPTHSVSIASFPTTNHPSPLPSPITPGLRHGEGDIVVKVAGSEPSCDGDEEVAVLETGVVDAPTGSIKPDEAGSPHHQRRRTASSGADVPMALPSKPSIRELRDIGTLSGASSPAPSVNNTVASQPKLPKSSHSRQSTLTVSTTNLPRSRHGSTVSLRTASPHSLAEHKKTPSRVSSIDGIRRDSVATWSTKTKSTHSSVSEDVLAAWGSLGGLRDYERPR
jgi:hypothetical protein